jgi:hypothetical protein
MEKVRLTDQEKLLKRRETEESLSEIIHEGFRIRRMPLKAQKEFKQKVRFSREDYTFLQHLPLLCLWATETKDIKQRDLNMLFLLQPLIAFRPIDITNLQKIFSQNDPKMIGRLKEGGWIRLYLKKKHKTYYVLTNLATNLIQKMHRMTLLEESLPMSHDWNSLITANPSKQNQFLMDGLKAFNQRARENQEK